MNAPIFAKYLAPASSTVTVSGYDHGGIKLNVTVERDTDDCTVTRITAADSAIDLFDIFGTDTVCSIAEAIDAHLSEEASKHNASARADRAAHNRAMVLA
ncbi:hypothetical protein BN2497_2591 [Janthinobacterium sp. CG23_2]|nr:hypothetical protein BN2497_65 [Janthinobacterium sp. CG23_2]CUI03907.1 hypothetical protein BN2497_2591 [Janthinobacterium sp. CG23_2]CUU26430.1 hypothetical protein BN3177_65 [Janthinobacterium sp. CG23_2]CUU27693.1 hypothetical protein BN3177_2591 [Janthinobacterium sp. CG23_2]